MPDPALIRIVDANANRAAEGLRVLEDCARFLLEDASLSRRAKELRHRLRASLPPGVWRSRDTAQDVGTAIKTGDEGRRGHLGDVIEANAKRVQEALRAGDEWVKLDGDTRSGLEAIRYACYDLERDLLACLPGQRLRRERLCVLVDTALCDDPCRVAAAAVAGGAGLIQLRAKGLPVRAYRDLAVAVCATVRDAGGLFVVNDHVAVAVAIGADGIHVGQDDLALADVRRVVGPLMLVGSSAHSPAQAQAAVAAGADYCGLGPMFATATKPHEAVRGAALLEALGDELNLPSYAIGGIDADRLRQLRPLLPHGVAVAGAVCTAADPTAVCRELSGILGGS